MNITIEKSEIQNSISPNGKIGLILLSTDQATLYEFEAMFQGTGILFLPSRVHNAPTLTPKVLLAIKDELAKATNTILPGIPLDVVAFSCTSASMAIGEKEVARIIKQSDENREIKAVTNPYIAVKNACKFLNINKLGLIAPYSKDVTQGIADGLKPHIQTLHASTFNIPNDNIVSDISPQSIINATIKMAKNDDIDTIFLSCTNLNICRYIQELESLTCKTIISSNQAMAWDILRLTNYTKPINGFGTLLNKKR